MTVYLILLAAMYLQDWLPLHPNCKVDENICFVNFKKGMLDDTHLISDLPLS